MSDNTWMLPVKEALHALKQNKCLWADIAISVEIFFAANPDEQRDQDTQMIVSILVFERLTAEPNTEKKIA